MLKNTQEINSDLLRKEATASRPLSQVQIKMIAEALSAVGEFGEVRLIVDKGRLRFVITQKSYDALKYYPGAIES